LSPIQTTEALDAPSGLRRPAIRWAATTRIRVVVWVPPLFVALLAVPFVLRQNAWWEWQTAYWLLERQTEHVAAHGTPTLFLHMKASAFIPQNLFYGGPTLSLLAYPAVVFGAWPVFVASIVAAMVAGYLGIWWTARNLGLSRKLAVLPALTFATTPYLLANLYGRGAWTELIGANVAAVILGAITSLIWQPKRSGRGASAALVTGGALLAGTHNLSLLMASLALPAMVLVLLPLAPRPTEIRAFSRAAGRVVMSLFLGAGLTAAWLLPNLWFGPRTYIASNEVNTQLRDQELILYPLKNMLWPLPRVPSDLKDSSWLFVQSPMVAFAWAVLALAIIVWLRRRRPDRVVLAICGLLALSAALLLVLVEYRWWPAFPRLIQTIQFPFRLVPYFAMTVVLALSVAIVHLRSRARAILIPTLALIVALQVGCGVWIALDSQATASIPVPLPRHGDVHVQDEPFPVSGPNLIFPYQFRIVHAPSGPQPTNTVAVPVNLSDPTTSDAGTLTGQDRLGSVRSTFISWSPFVRVDGDARIVGWDEYGSAVVRVGRTGPGGVWRATVRSRCTTCLGALNGKDPWQLLAGRALSVLSALIVAGVGGLWLRRWWRRSRVARAATR
jgi:hypothetical protein